MTIRTQLKAGAAGWTANHNETLKVRTALKAGGHNLNHNEMLQVRTALKAGGKDINHNEALQIRSAVKEQPAISMRKQIRWTGSKQDRLELLVVRAGLRAGAHRPSKRWGMRGA